MTHSLVRFAARRLVGALIFVGVVSTGAFALAHAVPGDAATVLVASGASPVVVARERARLGLDQPLAAQLARWVGGLVHGDLGISSQFGRPVRALVVERAAATAELAAGALLVATVIGVPLGLFGGAHPRHWLSRLIGAASLIVVSMPPLVTSLALLCVAAATGWLSMAPNALALPLIALSLPAAATLERLQRQAASDAMTAPDLAAAAARGVPHARLVWVHAARQALRPVLGVYGIVIGTLFGGSFVVEVVTAWPGLGRLMYDALRNRDTFLVAGCTLAGAVYLAAGNVLADCLRAAVDPRAREAQ